MTNQDKVVQRPPRAPYPPPYAVALSLQLPLDACECLHSFRVQPPPPVSMILPVVLKVASEEMVEIGTLKTSLARVERTGYVSLC